MDFKRIVKKYSSPPDAAPQKERTDNLAQVGANGRINSCSKASTVTRAQAALRFAKHAVQILPDEDDPIRLYSYIFADCNRPAMEAFLRTFSGAALLIVHIWHQQGIPRALRSCRSFHDPEGRVANLIVVGDERLPEDIYSFDGERSMLSVPAKDTYEALPQKVAKAFLFLGSCPLDLPIVKVDDDAVCEDLSTFHPLADDILRRQYYGGRVNPRTGPRNCSFWHLGKCTDPQINLKPDGVISTAAYATGNGYWLNSAAVTVMSKLSLIHEGHFEVEYLEDRAIGTAFVQYGIHPYHYDLVAVGALLPAAGGPWEEMPVHPRG